MDNNNDIKNNTLANFINNEVILTKLNYKKSLLYFNTCCIKSIIEINKKFLKLDKYKLEMIMGLHIFYHVFFVCLSHTNNLTFTIFLTERAILLYTEFIIMSRDNNIIKDLQYYPSISDAILFSYKKTIGTININFKNNIDSLKTCCLILRTIYIGYYLNNTVLVHQELKDINSLFSDKLYNYINKYNKHSLIKQIINIIDNNNNYYYRLLYLKIIIELELETYNFYLPKNSYTLDDVKEYTKNIPIGIN